MDIRDLIDMLSLTGPEGFEDFMTRKPPEDLAVRGEDKDGPKWRCLKCLMGGTGDDETANLAIAVHANTCTGTAEIAKMRFELLDMISGVSESWYAAGWLSGIETILLKRGGLWLLIANEIGFPSDWRGLDGWDTDALSALATHGISPAEVDVWPTSMGPRP